MKRHFSSRATHLNSLKTQDVCDALDISKSTLLKYERENKDFPTAKRGKHNNRLYNKENILSIADYIFSRQSERLENRDDIQFKWDCIRYIIGNDVNSWNSLRKMEMTEEQIQWIAQIFVKFSNPYDPSFPAKSFLLADQSKNLIERTNPEALKNLPVISKNL